MTEVIEVTEEIIENLKRLIAQPSSTGEMMMVSDWLDDSFQMVAVNE